MDHNAPKLDVGEQTPASTNSISTQPPSNIVTKTYSTETDEVDCQPSEGFPLHESDSRLDELTPCSPIQSQHNSTAPSAHHTPPPTLSTQTTRGPGNSDVMSVETCTASESPKQPSKPDRAATTEPIRLPSPLPLSESLGLEGIVGIVGGSLGILGIFGFLTFLWFGCKLHPFPR